MDSPKLVLTRSSARVLPSVGFDFPHVGVGRGVRGPGGSREEGEEFQPFFFCALKI